MYKIKLFFGIGLVLLLIPYTAISGTYSREYVEQLAAEKKIPDYCPYMGTGRKTNTELGQRMNAMYGKDWIHMHHFCWALIDVQRGRDGEALNNLDYVLRNTTRTFKLRPMVLEQKAQILILNNKIPEAITVYRELIEVKPESEEGYVNLSKIFLNQGDKKTAHEIAKQGLTYLPNSKKLKALLKKQGKLNVSE